jgi:hypothetical protein
VPLWCAYVMLRWIAAHHRFPGGRGDAHKDEQS